MAPATNLTPAPPMPGATQAPLTPAAMQVPLTPAVLMPALRTGASMPAMLAEIPGASGALPQKNAHARSDDGATPTCTHEHWTKTSAVIQAALVVSP